MLEELEQIRAKAEAELAEAEQLAALEAWRIAYFGKRGAMTLALRGIGKLPPEQRPEAGRLANEIRSALDQAFEARGEALRQEAMAHDLAQGAIDVRLPGRKPSLGYAHIINTTLREIYEIFGRMGFQVFRSREVEDDVTNFQLLNMPPHHPARDMWSTFYATTPGVLLRTHTSPGQIHAMREYHPEPLRVILPGRCYRYEQVTVRADHTFTQVEGLAIGRHITISDLKGVLANYARQMYGPERKMRFRASYFPFTEPSAEVDIDCTLCGGEGCAVCKYTGWVEILGCGMVHPVVLRNGGYDPDKYSGFAFGMGVERMCLLKNSISDIRYLFSGDVRFLQQFA
ncbi:MAG: phenylalanine--tRNA ligase subunit alpha [Anaerolineae bacterium]|nr:phenylalanine--tRNA ligase subunit alpha [Anaerolineae bacterium]